MPRRIVNNARTPSAAATNDSPISYRRRFSLLASTDWLPFNGKSRQANLSIFSNLRYQDRRSAGNAACAELRARPEMTVTATGPFIQIGAVFPRPRVGPAAFDRRRIGCSATPPGVQPEGGHATDQTSHGCMMKSIEAASSQQPKQGRAIPPKLCMNE